MKKFILGIFAAVVVATSGSASALSLFGFSTSGSTAAASTATTTRADNSQPCLRFQSHEYEVCTAYVANSSLAVLWPYYAYAKSPSAVWARYVTYRLGSRYTGSAYSVIQNRVAAWPAGDHDVAVPDIDILAVNSSLRTNTATLQTQESWRVTTESGRVLYQEVGARHTVTMQRVPSYLLHKWVVTSLR